MRIEPKLAAEEHEEDLRRLAKLRIMDDDFMRCVFRDQRELVQDVLRVITGIDDLVVLEEETQKDLKRIVGARSIELDVWAKDAKGTQYDMEVQRGDDPNPKRLRYYSACMDVEALDSGSSFSELPEQWLVYITEGDPFGEERGTYLYEYMRDGMTLESGTHFLYVNGSYRGDDALGSLMADFCQSDPDKISHGPLAERVRYWKESSKGVREMCEMLEQMRDEAMQRGIEQGMEQGMEQGKRDTLLDSVRSLMSSAGWSAQQALDMLRVPEAERAGYLALL